MVDLYVRGRAHEDIGTANILYPQELNASDLVVDTSYDNGHQDIVMRNYPFILPTRSQSLWHQQQWDKLVDLRSESLTKYSGQQKLDLIVERVRAGDYKLYTRLIKPNFTFAPLHAKFSELMEALLFKFVVNGMLSCGPRLGKSSLMCLLVTYMFGLSRGRANCLYTTYGAELTTDFGNEILFTIMDPVYRNLFPSAKLRDDSKAKKRFQFESGGKFFASSVGGVLTGKGAGTMDFNEFGGIAIIDDPVKEMSEAISPAKMARLHSWYDNEFSTRPNSNCVKLVTGTRYGVNDLHAHLLKVDEHGNEPGLYHPETNPDGAWVYLNIQTLCLNEEDDPLGRRIGESAWEEKISAATLYARMEDPDQFITFWALYQGRPQSRRGGIFKPWYLHIYDDPQSLKVDYIFMSIDSSFGVGKDETALTIFGVTADRLKAVVITQEASAQWEFPELVTRVKHYRRQWSISVVVIEDSATGKPLYQTLMKEFNEVTAVLVGVGGKSKQERLSLVLPLFKEDSSVVGQPPTPRRIEFLAGVHLPRLRYQLENFPFAAKDDLVDSLVIGATYFRDHLYMVYDYTGDMIDSANMIEDNTIIEVEQLKQTEYIKTLMDFGIVDDDNEEFYDMVMAEMGVSAMDDYTEDSSSLIHLSDNFRFQGFGEPINS